MFKTLSNSWTLAKECWEVLMQDKEMLVYPALTSVLNIAIMAMAYFYLKGAGFFGETLYFEYSTQQWIIGGIIALTTMYSCHFCYSFFEAALVASAIKRLRNENPTLLYGLGIASDRIPQIAGWSLYSTVFGIFVAFLKSMFRGKWLQKIVGGIAQTAWNVVTIFVLPLIVVHNTPSFSAIKDSASMVRQKWGEAATLEIGFGTLCSIAAVPVAGLLIISGFLQNTSPILSIAIMVSAIGLAVILGLVFAALNGIAKAVLFNFALGGNLPEEVHTSTIDCVISRNDRSSDSVVERRT